MTVIWECKIPSAKPIFMDFAFVTVKVLNSYEVTIFLLQFHKSNTLYSNLQRPLSIIYWKVFYFLFCNQKPASNAYRLSKAPRVGLEPTTFRLTAERSTTELSRIILLSDTIIPDHPAIVKCSGTSLYLQNYILHICKTSFYPMTLRGDWSSDRFPTLLVKPSTY